MKIISLICIIFILSACAVPSINLFSDDTDGLIRDENGNIVNELSKAEKARRDALVAGKSSRPSLASLDLQPARIDEVDIPELSLVAKRDQYEALLPLINDPIQKQQVAFRLADIKMLIAEQQLEQGIGLEDSASEALANVNTAQDSLQDLGSVGGVFADAISDYKLVLEQHSIIAPTLGLALTPEQQALNRKQMDAMYQLTRALDLSAQPDESVKVAKQFLTTFNIEQFNVTPYHLELYFRIGEYYFNRQRFSEAVGYYSQVVSYGNAGAQYQTNFYAISAYMLGWSHFKLDDYANAMEGFATMLDASISQINRIDSMKLDDLPITKGELRLVKDSIRVMALTFSYQGNAEAIQDFFTGFGNREYEQLIYNELAQQHLDNDRFQDSADVLVAFANEYPVHPRAVEFYIRHIDAFVLGDFPARVLLAKDSFVQTYSLGNYGKGVVQSLDTPIGRDAAPYLREYIKQLAQTEHSIAQGIDAILAARANTSSDQRAPNSGFVGEQIDQEQSVGWKLADAQDLQELSNQAYSKAKDYYENFIATFSPDPEVAELRFYLGEAHFALAEYIQAIEVFETYAYFDSPNPKAVEAAYAALLAYENLPAMTPKEMEMATASTIKYQVPLFPQQLSQARFIETFGEDERAPVVALTLMQDLFKQTNYIPAQKWAKWLLDAASDTGFASISTETVTSAMLVMAHSHFAMEGFAAAEQAYRELLVRLPDTDERKVGLSDRLAASLYKQAENLLVTAGLDTATLQTRNITSKAQLTDLQIATLEQGVELLQKVVTDTPLSEFRLAAHYDSAVYYSLLENWPLAIAGFIDFRSRYPEHPLSQGIEDQLYYAYEQTQDWPKAAAILMTKYNQAPNTETGRLALYRAAEYYEKAGDRSESLDKFRAYAHKYPRPLADANEARFTLSEFYLESGEDSKRRFWLNKLVQAQEQVMNSEPALSSPRSVYLASMAAMVFANDADNAFTKIKLSQPLAQSLQRKQSALKKAIQEYDRVMAFGSKEYVTAANYKLANLYLTLADDLMNSDRPADLSALELSQYEILLEEQAYPFEETAIDLHENNITRIQSGLYDDWIKQSFGVLKNVMPGRYNKPEILAEVSYEDF
ncbi:tetratricopeptide repeat protein [Glaciecola petra]|uniref:Tetratricopeptide repeat protein n=1 Tax=Glaciecola petra TaxID=3075602 RepID=A0ABU2ZUC7_9ALTE|nr:tetratricopeptide repeat protein [Aestuariibacter sp. P117]MDT0595027.1 tetratricopeptide repeat protein [Aestuariibacter sp. P117]